MQLIPPNHLPPLDPDFRPAILANRHFTREAVSSGKNTPLIIGLERDNGSISRFETVVFSSDHPRSSENIEYVERLIKSLVWLRGGWRIYIGGPKEIGEAIRHIYSASGSRAFDFHFLGELIYDKQFEVISCSPQEVPAENESQFSLGRHLEGCRIGFDLGASDIKVSSVIDGNPIFSHEIVWEPVKQTDPAYHRREILNALKLAASKLPRVDAIGGSSAGIFINNRVKVASLFRGIPKDKFDQVRDLFLEMRSTFGVPLEVINDGEVTALAGSMSLEENGILGIALGSSEAGGFVNSQGNITDWLNELAFAPVDFNPQAPVEEWSGDKGIGASYFSQQCVFRLAPAAGIGIPSELNNAEKLKIVQEKLESGHAGARQIWESIGVYMGYTVANYADYYDLQHVLILGRVTSGSGGQIILDTANAILKSEFPEVADRVKIQLPDEKSRRVGQSIAAASLPVIA
ncbi:MAG: ROK family protein [Leptolinea sp.]|jgi:predicted NBD/HSP70 family sugar kinase|nr:ROK family protein [Leptolinea sp.]